MKKTLKKLALNRETIRALQDVDLRQVVGGDPTRTCIYPVQMTGGGETECLCFHLETFVGCGEAKVVTD